MGVDKVYIVELKTFQSEMSALDNTLAGKTKIVDDLLAIGLTPVYLFYISLVCVVSMYVVAWDKAYFCRDNNVISFPAELLDSLTHHPFGFSSGVALSTIEEVDPSIVGGFHACECVL